MTARAKLAECRPTALADHQRRRSITGLWLLTESLTDQARLRSLLHRFAYRLGGDQALIDVPHALVAVPGTRCERVHPTRTVHVETWAPTDSTHSPRSSAGSTKEDHDDGSGDRQEMLRLVESIREKLDLALTLVALREAGASQQREAECDPAIKTFREESKRRELPSLGATEAIEAFREAYGNR